MKKNKIILIILLLIIMLGFFVYFLYPKNQNTSPLNNSEAPVNTSVTYTNNDFGFTFSLPDDWKGYSTIQNTWQGHSSTNGNIIETGPTILLRNPNWTSLVHYEDIPIMIFSLDQWNSYTTGDFSISAAPFNASELARNNSYVFALPPRWDFDYSKGYEEADSILKNNPLKAFDIEKVSILKDGQQCYTFNHEATATEPYAISEFLDINIDGTKVTGTKSVTQQKANNVTSKYSGTIIGTLNNDTINDVFSYALEGSSNKDTEIYKSRKDQIGLEKMSYPLIERNGTLVPDTTKDLTNSLYVRVGCTASNYN